MLTAKEENQRVLENLLGVSDEASGTLLSTRVTVTASDAASAMAKDLRTLLACTLSVVESGSNPDIEIAIGQPPISTASNRFCASLNPDEMILKPYNGEETIFEPLHGLTRRVGACYAAGYIIAQAVGGTKLDSLPSPYRVDFKSLGLDPTLLTKPIHLNNGAVLAGAGGIANGFIWGLEELTVSGQLWVADPKNVGPGNLNRCLFFNKSDLEQPKAKQLSLNASLKELILQPYCGEFKALCREINRVELVISTVDSRRMRRYIQDELPLRVLDASTTDISEIVVHSHSQPTTNACLACIYDHIALEHQREQHVADALGVTLEDIQKEFIDDAIATKLMLSNPDLQDKNELIGISLFSLFKARCAEGILKTPTGAQMLAPLAFISNLAGVLLALELVLMEHGGRNPADSNYINLDPWRPPHARVRRTRERNPNCHFCRRPELTKVFRIVWPEIFCAEPQK